MPLWSFQGARDRTVALLLRTAAHVNTTGGGLSKLNSVVFVEVDVVLGEPSIRTTEVIRTGSAPTEARAPDSLERR
jgi:hypothetical protein